MLQWTPGIIYGEMRPGQRGEKGRGVQVILHLTKYIFHELLASHLSLFYLSLLLTIRRFTIIYMQLRCNYLIICTSLYL